MELRFGKVAHAPSAKPDDVTAEYSGKHGDRSFRFDRPEKHTFTLLTVTKRASAFDPPREGDGGCPPEKTYLLDESYSPSEGVPPALEDEIRRYADQNCADDVTAENISIEVDLRH